jgi:hypothetical protein
MRQKYLDVVDEVEFLKDDLDAVSRDLDRLANGGAVELHATVDKFGKAANLKLHDAPLEEGEEKPPPKYTGLKLFQKPTVRQVRPFALITSYWSTFTKGYYSVVSKWRRLGRWNCSLICFTLGSLRSMRLR